MQYLGSEIESHLGKPYIDYYVERGIITSPGHHAGMDFMFFKSKGAPRIELEYSIENPALTNPSHADIHLVEQPSNLFWIVPDDYSDTPNFQKAVSEVQKMLSGKR